MKDKFRIIECMIVVISLLLVLTGYSFLQKSSFFFLQNQTKEPIKFGATYMTMNNPFFEVVNDEIENEIKQRGDVLYTMDPALSVDKQIEHIQRLIQMDIDVLFVNPIDNTKLHDVLEKCRKKGIIVIAVDTNLDSNDYVSYTVTSDNYLAGVLAAQDMMTQKESANIVLLEHSQTASGSSRIQGFVDTIESHPEYKIVARKECEGQLENAMPCIFSILNEDISFDVIMALNDPSALGAMAALEDYGREDVLVYGVDGTPETKVLIKDGKMRATSAQFPIQMGQKAIEIAYQLLEKKPLKTNETKISVTLITSENINDFSLAGWQ